jgi:hypothetical protein
MRARSRRARALDRRARRGAPCVIALSLLLFSRPASADPQWNAGVIASGCVLGSDEAIVERGAFCGAVEGDILFLRQSTHDFGLGPYAAIGTAAFSDWRASGGARLLFPIAEDFPLVASLGGVVRDAQDLGVETSLFWGVRSYNFHGSYSLAGGLVLSGTHLFAGPRPNAIALGVQLDAFVFAIPWLLLRGALK